MQPQNNREKRHLIRRSQDTTENLDKYSSKKNITNNPNQPEFVKYAMTNAPDIASPVLTKAFIRPPNYTYRITHFACFVTQL